MGTPPDREQATELDGAGVTATQVTICQWRSRFGALNRQCNQRVDSGHPSLCILHIPAEGKDPARFDQALRQKIKDEEAARNDIREIVLAGVEFPANADFRGHVFKKAVTFAEARFPQGADFGGTHFDGAVYFWGAHFERGALFSNADFEMGVYFGAGAQFSGEAYFGGAQFGGNAYFGGTHFGGVADFGGDQFNREAYFGTRAAFEHAHFDREAHFRRTRFGVGASFGGAQFGGEADFEGAQFGGEADFGGARFSRETRFRGTHFDGQVNFGEAHFDGTASFIGTVLPAGGGPAAAYLTNLAADSARRLRFEGVDLSRVSFLHTDLSQVEFAGCRWSQLPMPLLWPILLRWPRQFRTALFQEEQNPTQISLIDGTVVYERLTVVAEQYRQLRLNYERSLQEAEAGHFYIGQMEMRRQDPAYSRPYRWMLAVYRVLAMYGESYWRPPFFYFLFGVAFALAYLWGGFQVGQTPVKYQWLDLDWGNAVLFLQHFVRAYVQALTAGGLFGANLFGGQSGISLETTSWWVPAVRYVNMLLDTFLVGFFVIALRRHFHR